MAGWSVFEALTGFSEDAHSGALKFRYPTEPGQALPFLASSGWGLLVAEEDEVRIDCTGGRLNVQSLTIEGLPWEPADVLAGTIEAGNALIVRRSKVPETAW
jgi:hypothetical protein